LMRRLVQKTDPGSRFEIAVLGCSIGVEVYSIIWTLRSSRPDLELIVNAVDIAPDAVEIAERGVYSAAESEMVHSSICEGLTEDERHEMFEWDGDNAQIKSWLREGVSWRLGDASDPNLTTSLGPHDLVVANNFLCHMTESSAESCLRNL